MSRPFGDGLRFRPQGSKRTPGRGRLAGLMVVFALVGTALAVRQFWPSATLEGELVEVRGDVERPGWHRLTDPTVRTAVQAAGGVTDGLNDEPLHQGDLVRVLADGVRVAPSGNPLLVAIPVDVNHASADSLRAVPGIGEATAQAIVAHRAANGPFYDVSDLTNVDGVGASTVQRIASLLTVGDVGVRPPSQPLDPNHATAAQLERLPGIGPVGAARIVVYREEHGPFESIDALHNVHGIGPHTVRAIRPHLRIAASPQESP